MCYKFHHGVNASTYSAIVSKNIVYFLKWSSSRVQQNHIRSSFAFLHVTWYKFNLIASNMLFEFFIIKLFDTIQTNLNIVHKKKYLLIET